MIDFFLITQPTPAPSNPPTPPPTNVPTGIVTVFSCSKSAPLQADACAAGNDPACSFVGESCGKGGKICHEFSCVTEPTGPTNPPTPPPTSTNPPPTPPPTNGGKHNCDQFFCVCVFSKKSNRQITNTNLIYLSLQMSKLSTFTQEEVVVVVVIALLMVTGILACLLAAAGVARIKLAVRSEKG